VLDFENLQFLSCGLCRHAILLAHTKFRRNRTIGRWIMTKKANFKMAGAAILNSKKNSFFGHVTVTGFNIWCSVPNFIKIGQFFTEIWRFNDFQNGGRPPSWILHICIFCPVAFVSMPFCFLIQNFAEIGQSVPPLTFSWPQLRCDVGLEEGEYKWELSQCYSIVYYYNGAQRYEQFLPVGWLYRALILLGSAVCLPSASVFSLNGAI